MRVGSQKDGLSVHAIAGTHVILLGLNITEDKIKGLLGFAIRRSDHDRGKTAWLEGFKTFPAFAKTTRPGELVSLHRNPIQAFLWGDYTVRPDHTYTYRVVALYGSPGNLKEGAVTEVKVQSESESDGTHAVYFNRGVAGSQAYARKFGHHKPSEVPENAAYKWLSRGLEEAILEFISQAKTNSYSLRAAVYEFSHIPVLKAFGEAKNRGADVKIIYDHRKKEPGENSDKAIDEAGIRNLMIPREANRSYISHNKFIVLMENDQPYQVWTGSTNFTAGGIFGQSNVGHIVRDPQVAKRYLEYWERLSKDPSAQALRKENLTATPDPDSSLPNDTLDNKFSPRPSLSLLEWYARQMNAATQSVFLTAAFGVNKLFAEVLAKDRNYLRFLLMEKPGKNFKMITHDKDVLISTGAYLHINKNPNEKVHRMLEEELTGLNTWVKYIHTKYMIIDALTDSPLLVSGSANFSENSTTNNDENMLLVKGNTRVVDIYLGEFMRLFNHFYFRDIANRQSAKEGSDIQKSAFLEIDDRWARPFFKADSIKMKERLFFSWQKG